MPQKRNPYALAVIRSGAGTLIGRVTGQLVTQRTPSARTDNWLHAYGEVASSLELGKRLVELAAAVVQTLSVDSAAMAAAAGAHFTGATDLAEELVLTAGLDYRSAYRVVGRAVADAVDGGRASLTSGDLSVAAQAVLGRRLEVDAAVVTAALDPATVVTTRTAVGGAAPERVTEHAASVRAQVEEATAWRKAEMSRMAAAEAELVEAAKRLFGA